MNTDLASQVVARQVFGEYVQTLQYREEGHMIRVQLV